MASFHNRHLRSAHDWIDRAEKAFNKESEVRGELNLILAQAELQHARELSNTGSLRRRFPLLCNAAAFLLAALVAVAGIGGAYYWLHRQPPVASAPWHSVPAPETAAAGAASGAVLGTAPETAVKPVSSQETSTNRVDLEVPPAVAATVLPPQTALPSAAVPEAIRPREVTAPSASAERTQPDNPPAKPSDDGKLTSVPMAARERAEDDALPLSADEMQKLVRAAGKSLRGH